MAERKFTRGLNKPGMAAQLRETVSQVVRESAVLVSDRSLSCSLCFSVCVSLSSVSFIIFVFSRLIIIFIYVLIRVFLFRFLCVVSLRIFFSPFIRCFHIVCQPNFANREVKEKSKTKHIRIISTQTLSRCHSQIVCGILNSEKKVINFLVIKIIFMHENAHTFAIARKKNLFVIFPTCGDGRYRCVFFFSPNTSRC